MDEQTLKLTTERHAGERASELVLAIALHPDLRRVGEQAIVHERCEVTRNTPEFAGDAPRPLAAAQVSRRPVLTIVPDDEGAVVQASHPDAFVTMAGHAFRGTVRLDEPALRRGVCLGIEGRVALMLFRRDVLADASAGPEPDAGDMLGISDAMRRVRRRIAALAPLNIVVLLRGETGTGKELAARALHANGARATQPLLAVNLGAIDASVCASELFGHQRGAFTGATTGRLGYFRQVSGGTLFLDEVGEAPAEVQRALLRVLESGEVLPVGADVPVPVDVRLIAATDASLEKEIAERTFRAPLFHRLAQVEVTLPPLRARRVDIPVLFAHFLRAHAAEMGVDLERMPGGVPTSVVDRLLDYAWPGNARELRNTAAAALVHSLDLPALALAPSFHRAEVASTTGTREVRVAPRTDLSEISDDALYAALEAADWRPEPAAEALGIAKTSIYQLMRGHPDIPNSTELSRPAVVQALDAAAGDVSAAARALRVPRRGLLHRMKKLGVPKP